MSGGWRQYLPPVVRPYTEAAPVAALFLGISSGAPYAMIAATLTTRLAQDGIEKRAVTAFALAFVVYNLKWLWAWVVDGVRLPVLGRLGQRVSPAKKRLRSPVTPLKSPSRNHATLLRMWCSPVTMSTRLSTP